VTPLGHGADVVVVGSANVDLIVGLPRFAGPGETVLGDSLDRGLGGKGANQAVAAARMGARTVLLGSVGADAEGEFIRGELSAAGVDVSQLTASPRASGVAIVQVDHSGENSIVVIAGANAADPPFDPAALDVLGGSRVMLAQLEIPVERMLSAARIARAGGAMVILNAAPSGAATAESLAAVDLLVVNEHEAADLMALPIAESTGVGIPGAPSDSGPQAPIHPAGFAEAESLLRLAPAVLVTHGTRGSYYASRTGDRYAAAAVRVEAIDTTGAGDCYCGVLAAALSRGATMPDAMAEATYAAALCVQRPGAAPAMPTAAELADFRAARAG
jgi:ribokinase